MSKPIVTTHSRETALTWSLRQSPTDEHSRDFTPDLILQRVEIAGREVCEFEWSRLLHVGEFSRLEAEALEQIEERI